LGQRPGAADNGDDGRTGLNLADAAAIPPADDLVVPGLLPLTTMRDLLQWYRNNLCAIELYDPRGYRVRFVPGNFIHLIKLTNKYGQEPRNAQMTLHDIESERVKFVAKRFSEQRARELSWAQLLATRPDRICGNWQVLGTGGEAYVKNLGNAENSLYRVLICEVVGTVRQKDWGERTVAAALALKNEEAALRRPALPKLWPRPGNSEISFANFNRYDA
jgi:hypothetical protein